MVRKTPKKNAAAVELGKRRAELMSDRERAEFASSGGKARAEKLTKQQRSEIARKAVAARIKKLSQKRKGNQ